MIDVFSLAGWSVSFQRSGDWRKSQNNINLVRDEKRRKIQIIACCA